MRKTTIIISIMLCFGMTHFSCKTAKNASCVQVIQNSPATSVLPASEMNVIKSLFNNNRMDYANYQFYQLDKDDLGFHHVRCYQFVNNLRVFSADLIFHFNQNNTFYLVSGNQIKSIKLDDKPSLNRKKVVELFVQKLSQEKASMVDKDIVKGCFEIELGYAALDDSNGKFAKVWQAKPAGRDYPYAYINDDNSEVIYYDSGVRY